MMYQKRTKATNIMFFFEKRGQLPYCQDLPNPSPLIYFNNNCKINFVLKFMAEFNLLKASMKIDKKVLFNSWKTSNFCLSEFF